MKRLLLILTFITFAIIANAQTNDPTESELKKAEPVVPSPVVKKSDSTTFYAVEIEPSFPGGDEGFLQFIAQNVRYPENALKNHIQGTVFVQMVIDIRGKVTNAQVVHSVSPDLDAEALRVVNLSPGWRPGIQNGKLTPSTFTVPIKFRLALPTQKDAASSPSQIDTSKSAPQSQTTNSVDDELNTAQPAPSKPPNSDEIFSAVEFEPQFPGGYSKLNEFISNNINYQGHKRRVITVNFVVEKDGSLSDIKVYKGIDQDAEAECLRVMKNCPKWIAGRQNDQLVRVEYSISIALGGSKQQPAKVEVPAPASL